MRIEAEFDLQTGTAIEADFEVQQVIPATTIGNGTLTIKRNNTAVGTFTANQTTDSNVNITVPTTAAEVNALPDTTAYGADLSYSDGELQLLDQNGNNIGSPVSIEGYTAGDGISISDNEISVSSTVAKKTDIHNGVLTIQKNGTPVAQFSANSPSAVVANLNIPTTASDVGALPSSTTIEDLTTGAQRNALNSGVTSTTVSQVATNTQNISNEVTNRESADTVLNGLIGGVSNSLNSEISSRIAADATLTSAINTEITNRNNAISSAVSVEAATRSADDTALGGRITLNTNAINGVVAKIPNAATAQNQLADKAFVNSSINAVAAYYITSSATGDAFPNKPALISGPWYFAGQPRTPTTNDYAIVLSDSSQANATTRYAYDGVQWAFQYVINTSGFTQAQINAINSTITKDLVDTYSAHIIDTTNPHSVTKAQVGLGNVANSDTTNASNITSGTLSNDRLDTIPYSKLSGVASSSQGSLADTAIQPNDNVSELNNDAGYITSAYHDSTKVDANTAITGATKCKITYDSKGLVTAGADLSASDIPNLSLSKITDVTASATELNYCDGVTSNIQTQLNGKQGTLPTLDSGKYLTNNGTTLSWASVDALPSQAGQSGKYLTTDGTSASWGSINALQNTATGSYSLTVSGTASTYNRATNLGFGTNANNDATALGYGAGASGGNSVAVGKSAITTQSGAIAIGNMAHGYGSYGIAIGNQATADTGTTGAIQIGPGTNSTTGTMSVGLYNGSTSTNYQLLDANGNIPVERLTNAVTNKIGEIIQLACTSDYIPEGCLPCDGAEYTKAQFNDLWTNYLASSPAKLLTCSYADYQTDITTYGQCAKFAVDTTNNKFKVPTIKDGSFIQQANSNSELGKAYNAGLPNITGGVNDGHIRNNVGSEGAGWGAVQMGANRYAYTGNLYEITGTGNWNFDASRSSSIYGNSSTVQPNSVALRFFVVVSNGQINQASMDWSQWATSLAGRLDTNASNATATGKSTIIDWAASNQAHLTQVETIASLPYTVSQDGFFQIYIGAVYSTWVKINDIVVHQTSRTGSDGDIWQLKLFRVKAGDVITAGTNNGGYDSMVLYTS